MEKQCVFAVLDDDNPTLKTCIGKSGKIGSGPEDGCGFIMKCRLPVEKCRANCGAASALAAQLTSQPEWKTVMVQPSIGLGDAFEIAMRVLTLGTPSESRKKAWVAARNFVFGSWFIREFCGIQLKMSKDCGCEARRHRWNEAGKIAAPLLLRRWFPKVEYRVQATPFAPTGTITTTVDPAAQGGCACSVTPPQEAQAGPVLAPVVGLADQTLHTDERPVAADLPVK